MQRSEAVEILCEELQLHMSIVRNSYGKKLLPVSMLRYCAVVQADP